MILMGNAVQRLIDFGDQAVSGGYVLALATICLIQYLMHLHRRSRDRKHLQRIRDEVQGLESELSASQKDRALSCLENEILREFVSETRIDRALELLLRRFVPDARDGFGAFLEWDLGTIRVNRSRGLSKKSVAQLQVDAEILEQVLEQGIVALEGAKLHDSRLLASLGPLDRRKVRELYLVGVTSSSELVGVLLCTRLYPDGAPRGQQMELAQRLLAGIAKNISQARELKTQEHQLRTTSEMLELRSISDRRFESPLAMIETFLDHLRVKLRSDRVALCLASRDGEKGCTVLVRRGTEWKNGIEARWKSHEERIAGFGMREDDEPILDELLLKKIGVDTLIRAAMVLPLRRDDAFVGVLCFTKGERTPFTSEERDLGTWAAEHLTGTIQRALTHATTERLAREDGLTELANRRMFDIRIREELEQRAQYRGECALLLLDLDRFKAVNDDYGHLAGDHILRDTARILKEQAMSLRSEDRAFLARYGGEEMAILLPGIGLGGAHRIAESIRTAIEAERFVHGDHELRVTTSIGIAVFPDHAGTVKEMIAAADAALYSAKETGRNRVVTASMLQAAVK